MVTKVVAWNSGSGVITLTYTGQGNGSVSVKSDANDSFDARSQNLNIVTTAGSPEKAVQVLVKQAGKPLGWTTKNFGYTGSVQEVTLPKGRYKLQCWGAQGGSVTGTYAATGSKGGYSEGVITLTETTTLYIFVGGQGESYTSSPSQTDTTVLNGGWNGGGAGARTTYYDDGTILGISFPRGGGGGTDIALATSSMNYESGRTKRSNTSLLSRIIVAGGGAGASAQMTKELVSENVDNLIQNISGQLIETSGSSSWNSRLKSGLFTLNEGDVVLLQYPQVPSSYVTRGLYDESGVSIRSGANSPVTIATTGQYYIAWHGKDISGEYVTIELYKREVIATEIVSNTMSDAEQQGGGETGNGLYGGTQVNAGYNATFGHGASVTSQSRRYAGGGGGGGWTGGGSTVSDTNIKILNYSGGGSGFVNTADASYRPSGYTGLLLDSGSTTAGNLSHPSVNGGTEIGHSGNGYARITVL